MGESELSPADVGSEWDRLRDSDSLVEKKLLLDASEGGTSEIKDEEIEASSAACCRICLEYDGEPGNISRKDSSRTIFPANRCFKFNYQNLILVVF